MAFHILHQGLTEFLQDQDFSRLLKAFVGFFEAKGISIHRLQIPMSKMNGFRHPLHALLVMTWRADGIDVSTSTHEKMDEHRRSGFKMLRKTPYGALQLDGETFLRYDLRNTRPFEILQRLYEEENVTDYCAFLLPMPSGQPQVLSICTTSEDGFPVHLESIVEDAKAQIALTLFAAIQSSVSFSVAQTYLGQRTGKRVLSGDIYRGAQNKIEAGIMFCDIRGFTEMSERLGAEGVIPMINEIFAEIGKCVNAVGGEILKFIGDAMLVIFPFSNAEEEQTFAQLMITSAVEAVELVEALGKRHELPLSVGFGCHIGEVLYGNIGTPERLDFTVMGPSVNLTSRLESLCKPLGAKITVSERVYQYNTHLDSLGVHKVKGIAEEFPVWGVKR